MSTCALTIPEIDALELKFRHLITGLAECPELAMLCQMARHQAVNIESERQEFSTGDIVKKFDGDYTFSGVVLAVFKKKSGMVRICVENADGLIHIFAPAQLSLKRRAGSLIEPRGGAAP